VIYYYYWSLLRLCNIATSIKAIKNYNLFSKKLKILLLENVFYDVHEYFSCKFD
jgi:hypothetical protein